MNNRAHSQEGHFSLSRRRRGPGAHLPPQNTFSQWETVHPAMCLKGEAGSWRLLFWKQKQRRACSSRNGASRASDFREDQMSLQEDQEDLG